MSKVEQEIALALDIQAPCIWIKTIEEVEALNTIIKVLTRRTSCNSIYEFSIIKGLTSTNIGNSVDKKTDVLVKAPDFAMAVTKIMDDKTKMRGVKPVILKDFHVALEKPVTLRALRDLCEPYKNNKTNLYVPLIIVSDSLSLHHDVEHLITVIEYDTPSKDNIATIIRAFNAKAEEKGGHLITDREALELIDVMRGLTKQDIVTSMRLSVKKNGRVLVKDILNQKIELIKKTGILDYKVPTASFDEIGGNSHFKQWVEEVEACMQPEAKEFGIQSPKGYLALGVPGTSKTLMANALANKLNRPFIKLDVSKIMSRFVGESERNMARALELVQSCSPCVFLIDEIEKTLSGVQSSGQTDGGATAKVFGLLLEFLNDSKDVFTVMTSNDVRQLPPELTRAGRLDAIW